MKKRVREVESLEGGESSDNDGDDDLLEDLVFDDSEKACLSSASKVTNGS